MSGAYNEYFKPALGAVTTAIGVAVAFYGLQTLIESPDLTGDMDTLAIGGGTLFSGIITAIAGGRFALNK